jgi:hypothetical protein
MSCAFYHLKGIATLRNPGILTGFGWESDVDIFPNFSMVWMRMWTLFQCLKRCKFNHRYSTRRKHHLSGFMERFSFLELAKSTVKKAFDCKYARRIFFSYSYRARNLFTVTILFDSEIGWLQLQNYKIWH